MSKLFILLATFFDKVENILSTAWGWIITIAFAIIDFYGGYKLAFGSLGMCIVIDMILGVWSAIRQKKYARSELARDTFSKIVVYGLALVVIIHIEKLCGDTTIGTNICAAIMCATEFWSIGGNALIINPNLHFFRIMRPALIGEIARKLHVTESQVEEAFKNGDELINKDKTNN